MATEFWKSAFAACAGPEVLCRRIGLVSRACFGGLRTLFGHPLGKGWFRIYRLRTRTTRAESIL